MEHHFNNYYENPTIYNLNKIIKKSINYFHFDCNMKINNKSLISIAAYNKNIDTVHVLLQYDSIKCENVIHMLYGYYNSYDICKLTDVCRILLKKIKEINIKDFVELRIIKHVYVYEHILTSIFLRIGIDIIMLFINDDRLYLKEYDLNKILCRCRYFKNHSEYKRLICRVMSFSRNMLLTVIRFYKIITDDIINELIENYNLNLNEKLSYIPDVFIEENMNRYDFTFDKYMEQSPVHIMHCGYDINTFNNNYQVNLNEKINGTPYFFTDINPFECFRCKFDNFDDFIKDNSYFIISNSNDEVKDYIKSYI